MVIACVSEVREWLFLHVHRIGHQRLMKPQTYQKLYQRVKLVYAITIYCVCLILFVMALYVMHVDRDSD